MTSIVVFIHVPATVRLSQRDLYNILNSIHADEKSMNQMNEQLLPAAVQVHASAWLSWCSRGGFIVATLLDKPTIKSTSFCLREIQLKIDFIEIRNS